MQQITVKLEGMMCAMCESHVNDAIRRALPVKKVSSSHSKGETVILTKEDLTEDQIRQALAPTGYQVQDVAIRPYEKKGRGLFGFGKK
jgi:copper chaperone CopZ